MYEEGARESLRFGCTVLSHREFRFERTNVIVVIARCEDNYIAWDKERDNK